MSSASVVANLLSRVGALDPDTAAIVARMSSLLLSGLVLLIVYRLVVRVVDRVLSARGPATPRVRTLGALVLNVTRWLLGFVVLVVALNELGVDVRALLVSAGVVGLAVGFGAQSLVRDVIAGLFLLFEGGMAVGDLVEIGGQRGNVESIGLRVTRVRLVDGGLRIVPNGLVADFVNLSAGWGQATIDVTVPRETDVNRALAILRNVAEAWGRETGAALETPVAHGIMKITGGEIVLRLTVKVEPARRFDAETELRRRIRDTFDRERVTLLAAS